MPTDGDHAGRTVLVTGSASGIGAATKELLEAAGARVIGVDLNETDIVADLRKTDERARTLVAVAGLVDALDAVVICAGITGSSGEHDAASVIRVNFFGAIETLVGLRPLLQKAQAPRAALVTSTASVLHEWDALVVEMCLGGDEERAVDLAGSDAPRAYASSKRALARWVRRMAPMAEWAGAGIPLNAVAPGIVATPMTAYRFATAERRAEMRERDPQPLGIGEPAHVASLLAWLTSPANAFATGQVIFVDGGKEALKRGDEAF
jgi:NAD(P)-dependent dehydrogenase (short-subunit alcohol dehydrogenase family)